MGVGALSALVIIVTTVMAGGPAMLVTVAVLGVGLGAMVAFGAQRWFLRWLPSGRRHYLRRVFAVIGLAAAMVLISAVVMATSLS